jgi:glycerol-3-phosphate dehydrogenase
LNPIIDPGGVTGGAVWHDYQLENTDRMTFSFVLSAVAAGAVAANYARAVAFLRSGMRISGVRVEDRLTSEQFDIRATIVLNAAGPWASSLLDTLDRRAASPAPRLSRAINLVTRAVTGTHACGGLADGRFLFVVPWRNVSVIGTSHAAYDGDAETLSVSRDDLEVFLTDTRQAFPEAALTAADVRLVHRGLLPMVSGHATSVRLLRESAVIDHRRDKLPGLISMFGVRYTTARATAARAIDGVFRASGDPPPPCRTSETPVAGGAIGNKDNFLRAVGLRDIDGVTPGTLRRLAVTYGTAYDALLQIMRDQPALAGPLGPDCAVTGAEIAYAVRQEAAVKLADALIRRTEAGSAGHPGEEAIVNAAAVMARELRWSPERARAEIAAVQQFYRLPE